LNTFGFAHEIRLEKSMNIM